MGVVIAALRSLDVSDWLCVLGALCLVVGLSLWLGWGVALTVLGILLLAVAVLVDWKRQAADALAQLKANAAREGRTD